MHIQKDDAITLLKMNNKVNTIGFRLFVAVCSLIDNPVYDGADGGSFFFWRVAARVNDSKKFFYKTLDFFLVSWYYYIRARETTKRRQKNGKND